MNNKRIVHWLLPVLSALVLCASERSALGQIDDNLGFGWKSTAPAGYNVQLDAAKNTLRAFPGSTTVAIPLKLVVPNWNTNDPVDIQFMPATNPDPQSPPPADRFMLTMNVMNTTKLAWDGFQFQIIDGNNTDFPNLKLGTGGNLLHPDRAHFHADSILPSKIGFSIGETYQTFYKSDGNLTTRVGDLTVSQGVYQITLRDGFQVKPGDTWTPLIFDAANPNDPLKSSLLDLHDKIKPIGGGANITAFTLRLQPLFAPEPSSFLLLGIGSLGLLVVGARCKGTRRTSVRIDHTS